MRERILYYAVKYDGDWKKIERALGCNETWEHIVYPGSYITIEDEAYPKCFKMLEYAPWILFYEGDLGLCNMPACAIIGSRMVSRKGELDCIHVCNIVKKKYVIVSGLAKGIDGIAHRSSLDYHTIGVVGCGLHVNYPKENHNLYEIMRSHHLILSEYPEHSKPYAYHFPWRNRLIAALSDRVIVIEARLRSGTLLTVNEAITLDKEVYCIPHDFGKVEGEGCNLLISQGANILVDDEDICMI